MKAKIKATFTLTLLGLAFFNFASAAPFVGPLVKCGRSGKDPCTIGDLFENVYIIINFLVGSATILAIAYIVYGGVRMMLSRGNEGEVKTAKTTMFNAVVGLIIVILSYLIVTSVVSYLTGKSFEELRFFIRR